jgi:hypothetical protein
MCTGEEDYVDGKFDNIASVSASSLEDIPEGMVGAEVPAATYAVFTHKDKLDRIDDTTSISMARGSGTLNMNRLDLTSSNCTTSDTPATTIRNSTYIFH